MNAYSVSKTNTCKCLNLMAVKYDHRNQNKGNQWFIINFVTQGAFHETENIYDFIVSSL